MLPVFINDGAASTETPEVILTLTNEQYFDYAPGRIGYAHEVMVSNAPDFAGAEWQPWTRYVRWTLDASGGGGLKTVYVRFKDYAGYTVDSQASIMLEPGE